MRLRVEPRDVSEEAAARHLGLTVEQFRVKLSALLQRGFPAADPTAGYPQACVRHAPLGARAPRLTWGAARRTQAGREAP